MATFAAARTLGALNDAVRVPIVSPENRRILICRINGTFVGTFKIQSKIAGGAFADASVFAIGAATNANPTASGNFAAILPANSVEAQVICSAYTSGSAKVEAELLPYT